MKKSARLASVVKMAESEEHKAMQAYGQCQQQLEEHKGRLGQLVEYRSEYLAQFHERAGEGISVRQMQSYRAFISQLDRGIEEQGRVIDAMKLDLESKRREWFGKRTKTQAIDKVVEQHITNEQVLDNKREQKESDEISQICSGGQVVFD
ncbi:hypothetical protein MNBD_GAMMA18-2263 [hydrothermal vent metagenome]|uniref:Flagellar FliJ protein n=1 Tax=hydrothermal vent metagenome TaxID=652676 RepID=A0A3B1A446_9ZZZZ